MSELNENEFSYIGAIQVAGVVHKIREKEPLSIDDQQTLEVWLGSDAANAPLLEELLDRGKVTTELKAMTRYDALQAVTTIFKAIGEEATPVISVWQRVRRPLAIAASLLVLAGAAWWLYFRQEGALPSDDWSSDAIRPGYTRALLRFADGRELKLDSARIASLGTQGAARVQQERGKIIYTGSGNGAVTYNTIITPPGGQYQLQLADGTSIWLNAASSVTYPTTFTGDRREVTVTGEVYCKVAKDPARPFFVKARDMQVQVVGTEFNVMAYEEEEAIRTTLVTGGVKAGRINGQELVLQPGEQAALFSKTGQLQKEKVMLEQVIAWHTDTFRFVETPMSTILRQVGRWYDVKVAFQGAVADIKFSGNLSRKKALPELLEVLSSTRTLHFEIKDDKTIVAIPGPR